MGLIRRQIYEVPGVCERKRAACTFTGSTFRLVVEPCAITREEKLNSQIAQPISNPQWDMRTAVKVG
jgi:hypothetical protein